MRPTLNTSIELHDSRAAEVFREGDSVSLVLAPAYLHRSLGRPGVDSGTGWTQDARLVFGSGALAGVVPELPCDIMDGELSLAGDRYPNEIPIPLQADGPVELHLVFYPGCDVFITGKTVQLELLGEARYVEEFHP
jgi:hypothetical protein